jgi:NADPH-dependent glutamate synthase beta subunit-like oxidoreductase/NAD(P)H-flavin reductase
MDHLNTVLTFPIPGFSYRDLYNPGKLAELTSAFLDTLHSKDPKLSTRFAAYRNQKGRGLSEIEVSAILTGTAPHLSAFVGWLFGIEDQLKELRLRTDRESVIFRFKKEFVTRRALRNIDPAQAAGFDFEALSGQVNALRRGITGVPRDDFELEIAAITMELVDHERFVKTGLPESSQRFVRSLRERLSASQDLPPLAARENDDGSLADFLGSMTALLERWVAAAYHTQHEETRGWVSFRIPGHLDFARLVEIHPSPGPIPHTLAGPEDCMRRRDGFDLTDPRYSEREAQGEVEYCILCHERNKDSCSKGLRDGGKARKNPLGSPLNGCPLGQKISESHALKEQGDPLAALAVIMIDNPLLPGTGHRICNDCMKACIYQKQEPVNIPQVETRILTDILALPWGLEIYALLTRWNPLNAQRPHALPYNGMNILVTGLGPAGYTLAHYFLNEGFGVVGIDGLKIEPLPASLLGDEPAPIRDYATVSRNLSDRVLAGFGGVSEYGITVRWDKNFLTVLYLTLMRRQHFRVYDGIRLGGTISIEDAWAYGFDHACLATGAGKPTFVAMKNNLIRGIRKASDFLMALQLTGAGKKDSMANLQVQLPALVIGGGLTAIDTATELMAYYPVQVSKIKHRYDILAARYGVAAIEKMYSGDELDRLRVFLTHAEEIDAERTRAASAGVEPDFIPLLRKWGGVHICYRKGLVDSPAYRLNHEEVIKALEEGITFVENMSPLEAVPDAAGAVREMLFAEQANVEGKWRSTGTTVRMPAHTVMVAAGTVPNVMYELEHPGTFALDKRNEFFQTHTISPGGGGQHSALEPGATGFFTSYARDGRYVSFYGDNHPEFAGNVVKAMASSRKGYSAVLEALAGTLRERLNEEAAARSLRWTSLIRTLDADLRAEVVRVNRLTPTITEIVVRAPKAAREFRPGQFYRFQSYEVDAPRVDGTLVMMEGIALTGAWVVPHEGLIGLITLEVGASSRMCALLSPGQRVVLMGPTGTPTEIPEKSTVLLLGGGLGNAVQFSIAKACKARGNRVIYFAGYKHGGDFFKREEIETATDVVVYSVDDGEQIPTTRPQDRTFTGNIVQAMLAYARGELGPAAIPLSEATRIIAIGSDRMMAAVTTARHSVLEKYLRKAHIGVVSINSPMQCMMKAICAQCLQRHIDPATGDETFVFSCVNQDQLMDHVDFENLNSRLKANSVMEKVTNLWLDYLLERWQAARV